MDRCRYWIAAAADDESGVTAIEYGLLAALIVVASLAAFGNLSNAVKDLYDAWTAAVIAAL